MLGSGDEPDPNVIKNKLSIMSLYLKHTYLETWAQGWYNTVR